MSEAEITTASTGVGVRTSMKNVQKLEAEVERLREWNKNAAEIHTELRSEIERLRALNAELVAALTDLLPLCKPKREERLNDAAFQHYQATYERARAAFTGGKE